MQTAWPQIELSQPLWLAVLLVLPIVYLASWRGLTGFSRRRLGLGLLLRSLAIAAVVIALAGPEVVGVATPEETTPTVDAARDAAAPVAAIPPAPPRPKVKPQPRVLLVEDRPSSGEHLARALRAGRLAVEIRSPQKVPEEIDSLNPFDAVVLVNVPAASLSPRQMEVLKDYVGQGGGLVATGGDRAFTPGGYRDTALEAVLPVRSESHRKPTRPSLAMVFVVDRSLSMQEGQAIELAREAMRRAVELLRPEDQLGVLAFDEHSRWVSPIDRVGDRAKVLERIATITAEGRTDMAPALEKAMLALHEAYAGQKHILVLTDGISHPADFEALAERIARAGMTISTVALGAEASRPLLEDMARLGKGRFYLCANAEAVPRVFAMETASASKLGIREEPFFPRRVGASKGKEPPSSSRPRSFPLDGIDLGHAPSLLGYTETVPKAEAEVVLTSGSGDPLLAWVRHGEGVSVAFTSDAEGRWSAAWLAWPDFGRFWTQVVRGALRPEPKEPEPSPPSAPARALPEPVRESPSPHPPPPPLPIHGYLLAVAAVLWVLDATVRRIP